jgi:aconitate hydratase
LPGETVKAITSADLVAAAVLSGNRNFEGRVHPYVRANYLASPPLVVAYALAGTVDINLTEEPLSTDPMGEPVYLQDIWPTTEEVQETISRTVLPQMFADKYADIFTGNETWNSIQAGGSDLYDWDPKSTYIQEPPFFVSLTRETPKITGIRGARVLAMLGDSITTDHISPAGAIPADGPAGAYLIEHGVEVRDFNSFGSRRGNDRVMTRGTFGNIRLKNRLLTGTEGGVTLHFPDGEQMSIYEAAAKYQDKNIPLIVLAGKEYGTGSSRDWAAKGTLLLGVKAVIAESFERIHRSNLIGMGVLPLQFQPGESIESLELTGHEIYNIPSLSENIAPLQEVDVNAVDANGHVKSFKAIVRLNTPIEVEYYRNGGILHNVLRDMLNSETET